MLRAESAPQLIRERAIALFVPDLGAAVEAVNAAAADAGGGLQSRNGGRLSIAVPEARADEFTRRLELLGDVERQTARSEDVALTAADLEATARAARDRRDELTELLRRARNVNEGLLVERRIAELDAALAKAEHELRLLRQRITRVSFSIELREKPVEALPPVNLPFPWLDTLSGSELSNPSSVPEEESGTKLRANLDMSLNLEGRWLDDRPAQGENSRALLLAFHLRGARTDPIGIAAGYDAKLGGLDGFAYEFRGFVGVGTAIGDVFTLGLLAGLGVSGWTGDRVPASLELPFELFALFDLGVLGRLSLFAQPRWALTSEARRAGQRPGASAHEYTVGAAVLLPVVFGQDDVEDGGLRLGFEYGEVLQTPTYALSAGLGFGFPGH